MASAEAVAITRPRVTGDPVVGVCPSPLAPCLQILLDAATDVLLQNVQGPAGAPIAGATVSAEIFDVDDLGTPLTTILSGAFSDDGGGDYSAIFTPIAADGYFVGQRVQIVFDFDGPGSDDERIFNVIALVCDG